MDSIEANLTGINRLVDLRFQQDPRSILCVAHIANEYLLLGRTYTSSIIVMSFTGKISVMTNLLVKYLMARFNYKMSIAVKFARTFNPIPSNRFIAYKTSSYFAFVNETREAELTVR